VTRIKAISFIVPCLMLAVTVLAVVAVQNYSTLSAQSGQIRGLIAQRHRSTQSQLDQNLLLATHANHTAKVAAHRTIVIYRTFAIHGIPLAGPGGKGGSPGRRGFPGRRGPVGPGGPAGARGPAGATGAAGGVGQTGNDGPGPTDSQLDAALMTFCGINPCQGPPGPAGPAGPAGPQGDVGPAGPAGTSPTVTPLAVGDPNCPLGGVAITDAAGTTGYVCSA
jgi:hypothetical protein